MFHGHSTCDSRFIAKIPTSPRNSILWQLFVMFGTYFVVTVTNCSRRLAVLPAASALRSLTSLLFKFSFKAIPQPLPSGPGRGVSMAGSLPRPGLLRDLLSPGMQRIVKLAFGPAAPEVADQRCRVEQPLLLHVQCCLLDVQLSRLRRRDRRVVHGAGLVFVERDLGAARCVAYGALQHIGLLRKDAQADEVVLHPLEGRQYGAAIVGHGRVVPCLGRGDLCIARAAIK